MRYPNLLVVIVIGITTILAVCSISTMCYWNVKNADNKTKYALIVITNVINGLLVATTIYYTYYYVYKKMIYLIFMVDVLIAGSTVLYTNFKNMETIKLPIKIVVSVLTNMLWVVFIVVCVYGEFKLIDIMDKNLYFYKDGFLSVGAWVIWLVSIVVSIVLTVYIIYKSQIVIISRLGNCEKDKISIAKSVILFCINMLPFVFWVFAWIGELD